MRTSSPRASCCGLVPAGAGGFCAVLVLVRHVQPDVIGHGQRFLPSLVPTDVGRVPHPPIRGMEAGPERMWHISPRRNRSSILTNGLRLSDVDQRHIWLFAAHDVARGQLHQPWGGDRHPDLWEVDTSGYEVLPDPHSGWGDRDLNAASRVLLQPIPPERCRLLAAA